MSLVYDIKQLGLECEFLNTKSVRIPIMSGLEYGMKNLFLLALEIA